MFSDLNFASPSAPPLSYSDLDIMPQNEMNSDLPPPYPGYSTAVRYIKINNKNLMLNKTIIEK